MRKPGSASLVPRPAGCRPEAPKVPLSVTAPGTASSQEPAQVSPSSAGNPQNIQGAHGHPGQDREPKSQCSAPSASLFPTHCLAIQASDTTSLVLLLSPPPRLFFLQGHLRAPLGEARPQPPFPCFAFFPAGHFLQNLVYCRSSPRYVSCMRAGRACSQPAAPEQ